MKVIIVPIKTIKVSSKESDTLKNLGIYSEKEEYIYSDLYVNVKHIISFNKDLDGLTILTTSSGEGPIKVYTPFDEFLNTLMNLDEILKEQEDLEDDK